MSENNLHNIPSLSVENIIDMLSNGYSNIINNNLPVKSFPSVMLWGAPGVGKSQAVKQIAKEIENKTNKKVFVTDVRLLLFNPIDLRGIPTANKDKTLAIWLKPQIFQMNDSDDVINILFLDEISAAPQMVQASAYQITLDRVVGEHKLPENCIVISAGNRMTDKSVAFKMPKALANRMMHINVGGNFDSWKKWAIQNSINEKIISFLNFKREYLFGFDSTSDDLAFPTPRTWEMVSNILNYVNDDVDKSYGYIAGLIGTGVATELRSYTNVYSSLPNIDDIFNGKSVSVPTGTDALYALCSSILFYAREHKTNMNKIRNSIVFANSLPPDFSTMLLKDYIYIEKDFKEKLLKIPEFNTWLQTKGKLLNGNI